jgi:hypothetical protein
MIKFERGNLNRLQVVIGSFLVLAITFLKTMPLSFPSIIWGKKSNGYLYQIFDDSDFYLGRVSSILRGNFLLSNPFMSSESNGFGAYTFLGDYWLAICSKLTGSINTGFFIDVSVKSLILFVVLAKLLKYYFKQSEIAALIILLLIFGLYPVWLVRPVNPSTGVILFIIFVYFYSSTFYVNFNRTKLSAYFLVCFLIWLAYPHLAIIVPVTLTISYLIRIYKLRGVLIYEKTLVIPLLGSLLGFVLWFSLSVLGNAMERKDSLWRIGELSSRMPGGMKESAIFICTIFVIFVVFFVKRELISLLAPLVVTLFSSVLAMNHQLITGRYGENAAHTGTAIYLISTLIFIIILFRVVDLISHKLRVKFTLFQSLILAFLLTIGQISDSITNNSRLGSEAKEKVDTYLATKKLQEKLEDSGAKNVSLPDYLATSIPLYTGIKALYTFEGTLMFPMKNSEVMERFILNRILQGDKEIEPKIAKRVFVRHFINLEARRAFNSKRTEEQLFTEVNQWQVFAERKNEEISNDLAIFIKKYNMDLVVFPSFKFEDISYDCAKVSKVGELTICTLN